MFKNIIIAISALILSNFAAAAGLPEDPATPMINFKFIGEPEQHLQNIIGTHRPEYVMHENGNILITLPNSFSATDKLSLVVNGNAEEVKVEDNAFYYYAVVTPKGKTPKFDFTVEYTHFEIASN